VDAATITSIAIITAIGAIGVAMATN